MILRDISVLYRCGNMYYQAHSKDGHRLTGADPAILHYVFSNSPVSQDKIVKTFMMDRATITKSIDRLEQMGYLHRQASTDDKRARIISITQTGEEAATFFSETMGLWINNMLTDFTPEEVCEFKRLSAKACKNAWHTLMELHKNHGIG